MKRLLIPVVSILVFGGIVHALPVGNPSDPVLNCRGIFFDGNGCSRNRWEWISLRAGFYGDYVFNRNLEVDATDRHDDIQETEINTNAGFLALNLCNRFDVFGTLGASNIFVKTPRKAFRLNAIENDYIFIQTSTDFSWSVGARWAVFKCGPIGIGIEGQYFSTSPNINYISDEASSVRYHQNEEMDYEEWQGGIGFSYTIPIVSCATALVPYLALKWADAHVDMDNFIDSDENLEFFDLESKKNWGFAVGLTLTGCRKAGLTVEGRFGDERALYLNSQFRF